MKIFPSNEMDRTFIISLALSPEPDYGDTLYLIYNEKGMLWGKKA